MYIEGLDDFDNKILEALQEDARMSFSDIGKRVGLSRVSVKKRMEAMEEKGVIRGYRIVIEPEKAQEGSHFFLDLSTTPEVYEDMAEYLARNKYVRKIFGVSGECAIHAEGYLTNSRNMHLFASDLYRTAGKGLKSLKMVTVLSTIMDIDGGVEYVRYQKPEHLEGGENNGGSV